MKNIHYFCALLILLISFNTQAQTQVKPVQKFNQEIIKEMKETPRRIILRSVRFNSPKIIVGEVKKVYKTASGFIIFTNEKGIIHKYLITKHCSVVGIYKDIPYKEYASTF